MKISRTTRPVVKTVTEHVPVITVEMSELEAQVLYRYMTMGTVEQDGRTMGRVRLDLSEEYLSQGVDGVYPLCNVLKEVLRK